VAKSGSRDGYGTFVIILASALVVIAVFVISRLEVYETTSRAPVPDELRANSFYVLGKWLSENGHPVRFSPRWAGVKDLSPQEGGLFLLASLVDWKKDGESLVSWVQDGGALVISVDSAWYWRMTESSQVSANLAALEGFLSDLGLILHVLTLGGEDEGEDENENGGETGFIDVWEGEVPDEDYFPDYDWSIGLEPAGEPRPGELILRDEGGKIRLIRMALGRGRLTVTGSCYFMYNYNLDNGANARLSWELTGASLDAERPGMFFARERRAATGLFGALRERGNLLPPVVSILALVIIGFWTTVPGFGLRREEEPAGRGTVTGRFTAEARFIRRYGAYGTYLEAYLRELRRRNGGREGGQEIKEVETALSAGEKIDQQKMAVYLRNLMSALERI
jgi:hypothetical protein